MRYISTFSGIEAASVAWIPLGWEPLCFSEIDSFPSAVLAEHFPQVTNLGDITQVDWSDYFGSTDVLVGGSPCQSFSVAGSRTGLLGASGLMWEYVRAVRDVMPRVFVWENVPGALSSAKGNDFRCLLESMDDLGYGLAWRVLDAQFFGVAQRRRRVFLVGCLRDTKRAAEILFEQEGMRWDNPSSRDKREELAGSTKERVGSTFAIAGNIIGRKPESGGHQLGIEADGACYTLTAADRHVVCMADDNAHAAIDVDMSGTLKVYGSAPIVAYDYVVRRLMPIECERIQGFPDGWTDVTYKGKPAPDTRRYKAIGNSMAVPVMRWIGERIETVDKREDER